MKKTLYRLTAAFFAIVVSFAAVLALAGCGSSKQLIQVTAVKRIKSG